MSLTEQVYQKLRLDILGLAFGENEFLSESQLAARYSVSKAPLREALARLCMEGALVSYPRKGYLLAPVSQQEFLHAQHLRFLCEGYAVELAVKAPPSLRERLLDRSAHPYAMHENTAFHREIAAIGGVKSLVATVERLLSTVERTLALRYQASGFPPQPKEAHRAIAAAIVRGDVLAAKRALSEDLRLPAGLTA